MVSLISTFYNLEAYASENIESLISQTYQDLEIILVNDGSTDNTSAILHEYESKDSRIKVLDKENGGVSDARNKGFAFSSGDFVSFVDGDDRLEPTFVEDLMDSILKNSVDLACSEYFYNDMTSGKYVFHSFTPAVYRNSLDLYDRIMKRSNSLEWQLITSCGKLANRKVFEGVSWPLNRYCEDASAIIDILYNSDGTSVVNKPLYFYRQWSYSLTHDLQKKEKLLHDDILWRKEHIARFKNLGRLESRAYIAHNTCHFLLKHKNELPQNYEDIEIDELYKECASIVIHSKVIPLKSRIKYATIAKRM